MAKSRRFRRRRNGIKKLIKNMINKNTETKTVINGNLGNVPCSAVGQNFPICELQQGVDQHQRIGNLVKVSSFRLKGILSGGEYNAITRIIIYIPKKYNVMMPTNTSVYGPIDQDSYTILSDRLVTTNVNGQTLVPYNKVCLFNKGRRNGINVRFDGGNANNLIKNGIVVYFVSSVSATATLAQKTKFIGWSRFYYKDA